MAMKRSLLLLAAGLLGGGIAVQAQDFEDHRWSYQTYTDDAGT